MRFNPLHAWPQSARDAIALQRELAGRVRLEPIEDGVRFLGGADLSISRDGEELIAGIVVWDMQMRCIVEQHTARVPCRFPYVPGLLSFREIPGILEVARKLRTTPDALLCDAQGLAHPRRFGLACHLGLWLDLPTVGCAKSRLCGEYREPAVAKGCATRLVLDGEQVGVVLRTRGRVKPIFVSPGHRCDHASAKRLALAASIKYRLPEPVRLAHQLVTRARSGR